MTEPLSPAELATGRKADLVAAIAHLLGIETPAMSTGSTEPREIFVALNQQLGLGLDPKSGKPDLARGIVEASGAAWLPTYESRGATITKEGLQAVYTSVWFFLAK